LQEETGAALHNQAAGRRDREIERKRQVLENKIATLKMEFESIREELNKPYQDEEAKRDILEKTRSKVTAFRIEQRAYYMAPDPGNSHAGPKSAGTYPKDHRRLVKRREGAGGIKYPACKMKVNGT
jgi:hypothetical protein